jgi:hypothetical protein
MSIVLRAHQQQVARSVAAYQSDISAIERDIRLRAMSSDVTYAEIAVLQRLKDEKMQMLYRYENLTEALNAILGDISIAAE